MTSILFGFHLSQTYLANDVIVFEYLPFVVPHGCLENVDRVGGGGALGIDWVSVEWPNDVVEDVIVVVIQVLNVVEVLFILIEVILLRLNTK